jgi:hypothetical protein
MRFSRQEPQRRIANAAVNLAGTGFSTDVFDTEGYNQLTVITQHTWVAASVVTFYLQFSEDGGTTWNTIQSIAVAGGVATLTPLTYTKELTASDNYSANISINYSQMRLVYDSTGGTTDTDTVYVLLSHMG